MGESERADRGQEDERLSQALAGGERGSRMCGLCEMFSWLCICMHVKIDS